MIENLVHLHLQQNHKTFVLENRIVKNLQTIWGYPTNKKLRGVQLLADQVFYILELLANLNAEQSSQLSDQYTLIFQFLRDEYPLAIHVCACLHEQFYQLQ